LFDEILGNGFPLGVGGWIFHEHLVLLVLRNLPAVGGVSFSDVYNVEVDFPVVILRKLFDRTDRFAKRRSGATTENEHDGLVVQIGQFNGLFAIQLFEFERGRHVSDFQVTFAGFERVRGIDRPEEPSQDAQSNEESHGSLHRVEE